MKRKEVHSHRAFSKHLHMIIDTPIAFAFNEAKENCGKYFLMSFVGHVTGKLTLFFRRFRSDIVFVD